MCSVVATFIFSLLHGSALDFLCHMAAVPVFYRSRETLGGVPCECRVHWSLYPRELYHVRSDLT